MSKGEKSKSDYVVKERRKLKNAEDRKVHEENTKNRRLSKHK